MVFYRHTKIYIGFDCEDDEGNVHTVYGGELREVEFDPVEFDSRSEAYSIWGGLEDWVETTAANIARSEAEAYCGDETFKATNVNWDYSDEREWGDIEIPSDVLGNIEVILREMKENIDNIDYVEELKSELDRLLERNDLTREDIRDLIEKRGLGDVLL